MNSINKEKFKDEQIKQVKHLFQLLENAAQKWPEKIAIYDQEGELTFASLLQQSLELKSHLTKQGVQAGNGLGILFKNGRHFIIALFAGLACDALVMPISIQQKKKEIEESIKEAKLHFLLSEKSDALLNNISSKRIKSSELSLNYFLAQTKKNTAEATAEFIEQAALMRFTSGTTGQSKGVILRHQSVLERIKAANEHLQLNESDRVLWVLPMAYHFVVSIVLYIKFGIGIIVCNSFLAKDILAQVNQHKGTLLYASPTHIKLLAADKSGTKLNHLKTVISTTSGITSQMCVKFHERYNLPVTQAFGIIEVGLPIINRKKSAEFPEAVGYALSAYEVGILDENNEALPPGQNGQLAIKGPGMFDGYLNPPIPRAEVLVKDWFLTGDIAVKNEDGLISIKGRKKQMINVSGNKVFPIEVEKVINQFQGIEQSRVYAFKHALLGEIVAAEVITKDGDKFAAEALIAYCQKYLSGFKVPQKITVVDQIEMTGSGKIKRR